jgi:hypothetical protein
MMPPCSKRQQPPPRPRRRHAPSLPPRAVSVAAAPPPARRAAAASSSSSSSSSRQRARGAARSGGLRRTRRSASFLPSLPQGEEVPRRRQPVASAAPMHGAPAASGSGSCGSRGGLAGRVRQQALRVAAQLRADAQSRPALAAGRCRGAAPVPLRGKPLRPSPRRVTKLRLWPVWAGRRLGGILVASWWLPRACAKLVPAAAAAMAQPWLPSSMVACPPALSKRRVAGARGVDRFSS